MTAIVIVEGRADGKPEVRKATKAWIVCILGRSRGTIKPSSSQAKTRVLRRYLQLPSLTVRCLHRQRDTTPVTARNPSPGYMSFGYRASRVMRLQPSASTVSLASVPVVRQAAAVRPLHCQASARQGHTAARGDPPGPHCQKYSELTAGVPVHAVGRALIWRLTLLPPAIVTHRQYSLKAMLPLATGVPRQKMQCYPLVALRWPGHPR